MDSCAYLSLQVGDRLTEGRYRRVHKLGHGGHSTIWLARDLQNSRYVAVKVIIAFSSGNTDEPGLLRYLRASSEKPGGDLVRPLLDEFWVAGPVKRHRCWIELFSAQLAQSIIDQLIPGIAFLHSENIAHGDM
ncbi:kinase-like protein [Aspergillus piperis CBS 112811]|uniref:non-specific serine/threonine protein kinase n=1 Tax=Aspergillus piperis CBS 112811 TaxID=1448313 RepID=A0A8G1VL90_9EURO|nr:kinase-like protein [Aspergillus piperis CBS 112811]RAH57559.1 kinase-like protein [Aspergillus piperis CBS 112811]